MSMQDEYISITIGNKEVLQFLKNYEVTIKKVYDENLNYEAVSGQTVKSLLGIQRELKVSFEPMASSEIASVLGSIELSDEGTDITYIDPLLGVTTKTFNVEQLPAATYFRSDDGVDFWILPDITFTEKDIDTSSWGGA